MATTVTLAQLMIDVRDRADMLPRNYVPISGGGGGGTFMVISVSSNYSALNGYIILVDASAGPVTITIPAAAANLNGVIEIKKVDASANAVTIARTAPDLLDGQVSLSIPVQYDALKLVSDGASTWNVF